MPVWFALICGIVLERKKLPEIGKVARNRKSCPKVSEHLVDSLSLGSITIQKNLVIALKE